MDNPLIRSWFIQNTRLQSIPPQAKLLLLQALVIVTAGLWVFSTAIHGNWLWDDDLMVTDNAALRTLPNLGRIWWGGTGPDYWPLTSTLLWAEWHLWGNNPVGYRLFSLVLHLLSALLVWRLLARLGLSWGWLGGLLFVIHPLVVESVAWVSEIKNTLSLPFFLLALDAWLDAEEGQIKRARLESFFCFLAAMLSKASVVMLPVVLLLYCWWKRGRITRDDCKRTAPYFIVALVLGLITFYFQSHQGVTEVVKVPGLFSRTVSAGVAVFFYLGKFLLPMGLLPIYPKWICDPPSIFQMSAWPLLAALLVGLWTQRKGWGRPALFGLAFFLVNLLPVLGMIKMSYLKISPVADHFVYLPMIGLIGLVVAGLETLSRRCAPGWRSFAMAAVASGVLFLAWESHRYANTFINQETLWTYTLERNPDCKEAHNNYGLALLLSGDVPKAADQFKMALRINPDYSTAHNNLGYALEKMGRFPEAIEQFKMSLRITPEYAPARDNLARVEAETLQTTSPAKSK